jgi:predicted nuclease with TOPRIM domain
VKPKNPMVVLTQAESTKLLDSNKPKALYQIFLQATNLDKIGSQYNAMDKEMKHCKEQMAILANDIESHSTTIDELEVRLKSREEFSNIQEKIYICDATRGIKTYQDKDEHVQMLLKQQEKKKKKVFSLYLNTGKKFFHFFFLLSC